MYIVFWPQSNIVGEQLRRFTTPASFTMAAWSGGSIQWCLLLLLLLPILLLAQDDCSHNCKNEANRYYYVRPEGSAETLCPAQPCLTPSQLREHFSECEHNNFCQTANTSLVLLPGTYTSASNHGSFIPPLKFLSLSAGYNEDCNTDSLGTPSIDCNGTWISLMFQHIKCLHVRNCVVFTGHGTTVELDNVTFRDSLIRLASITAADHSELNYNYTLGSQSYCLLQKQLAVINALMPRSSVLTLRNVSFSSDYHTTCAREYGIQLATIHATDSALDIADCLFTQNTITHISLLNSTLHTLGMVQFENANTALIINSSTLVLAGVVNFFNNDMSAIRGVGAFHNAILLVGTVEFTNNTADYGGAISLVGGNITIADNAQVVFQGNHAKTYGGAIFSHQHVTIAGYVQFINNSANQLSGGAVDSDGNVTIGNHAQVVFQGNHAKTYGGAIASHQHIKSFGHLTIAHNAQVVFRGNHAESSGGAVWFKKYATIAGSVQFINNSARYGGAIYSLSSVTISDGAQVVFQGNHAMHNGGAIVSGGRVTIAGSVQFINNSANQGGAINSRSVTIANNSQVDFQDNHAFALYRSLCLGGAIVTDQYITIAGSVQFINNCAEYGGAISCHGSVIVADNAQVVFQGNHAKTYGGAIKSWQHVTSTIAGSVQFINNSAQWGGAMDSLGNVTIAGSVKFFNNSAYQGGAIASGGDVAMNNKAHMAFQGFGGAINSVQHVIAGSVNFINNSADQGGAIYSVSVTITDNIQVVFQGNHAHGEGGAIVTESNIVLAGSVQFLSNTAQIGGAIAMFPGNMIVANNAQVVFLGNHAYHVGGAIYSSASTLAHYALETEPCSISFGVNSTVDLLNNTAERGGSAVYGITMSKLECHSVAGGHYKYLFDIITIIPDSFSSVSSDPLRVCICPGQSTPDCLAILPDLNIPHLHYTVYSGQNFTIPAAVVGFNFALTSGSVYAQFLSSDASLGSKSQYVQGVNQTRCSQLQYSVLSGRTQETLVLTANGRQVGDIDSSIKEDIKMQNDNSLWFYSYYYYTKVINNQTIRRHGNIWVNSTFSGNTSNGVIVHKHCPFEYCKPEQLDVNLTHPETQCAFDHYGTLCGACKPNFSLALGGSQCLPNCSNEYLLLLIVFIVAGFALVFFIKILNLTVSQGTINGLIFYANVVAANRSILLPAQYSKVLSFLSVFISGLNLDLGFETCFIKGLDGYWKTWLQFAFPFYIWLIAAAIILVSHYSTRATKIFGDKSVSVLATLFLLSYAKLLRSIITIFSFTTLEYPDKTTAKVWSFDGNLQYLSSKHIPLFLFALAIVLLLWLPYTAVLLSAQWLRTQTHRKGLRWLKPFLDAYYGPFKDKHHYWVGVLLVVRGVLFVFFASFFAIENNVNLLLISITPLAILLYTSFIGRLYKTMYATILENLCFLNLGVLGIGTFYIRVVGGNQGALVTTSIGTAFLEFCGVTMFHSYQFVILPIRNWYLKVRANRRSTDITIQLQPLLNSDVVDKLEYMPRNEVTTSEILLSQLREEQDPPNPTTSAELPPADVINITCSRDLTPFDSPNPEIHPTKLTDAVANEAAGAPSQSEAAAVSLDQSPPQESSEPPRYFAAEREERFIDFNAPRESLLEYTQYRLPQERNEPARDSTAERELLSAPHEHPQESSEPRYFAADREGPIDFTAPRESLLDYTQ